MICSIEPNLSRFRNKISTDSGNLTQDSLRCLVWWFRPNGAEVLYGGTFRNSDFCKWVRNKSTTIAYKEHSVKQPEHSVKFMTWTAADHEREETPRPWSVTAGQMGQDEIRQARTSQIQVPDNFSIRKGNPERKNPVPGCLWPVCTET